MKPSGVQLSRPIRAAGAHHADELVGGLLVVRREHHADAGHDGVERPVGVRQRLGVGGLPVEGEALGRGGPAADLEKLGREVGGGDPGAAAGRGQRHVARAGGDVEDALAGADADGLDEDLAEVVDDLRRDRVVVAQRPHLARAWPSARCRREWW